MIPRLLLGVDEMVRMLDQADALHSAIELSRFIASFPGVLEMLPASNGIDFFKHSWWAGLEGAAIPTPKALVAAAKVREKLTHNGQPRRHDLRGRRFSGDSRGPRVPACRQRCGRRRRRATEQCMRWAACRCVDRLYGRCMAMAITSAAFPALAHLPTPAKPRCSVSRSR